MDGAGTDAALAEIARECAAEFTQFHSAAADDVLRQVPTLASVATPDLVVRMTRAHADAIHSLLAHPVPREAVRPAEYTASFARTCARLGLPAATVLQVYQHGHEALWNWWSIRIAQRLGDADARAAVTARLAALLIAYVSEGMALTVEVHSDELAEQARGASWLRRATVVDILERRAAQPARELSAALGYDLDRWHLGFVIWNLGQEPDDWVGLETAARALALSATGLPPLLIGVDGRVIWGWVADGAPPRWADTSTPVNRLRVAVGQPGRGIDGFRLTHREATLIHALGEGIDTPVRYHRDLATVALLRDDPELQRRYLDTTLGALAAPGTRERRLRETVRGYLRAGENVQATARTLHLHRNTVQQHLDQAAALRGRPLSDDRLAVGVALELVHRLTDDH